MTTTNPKPTADVIELVKELQAKMQRIEDSENEWKVIDIESVKPIAESLIIACEALEEIASCEWSACHECEGRCELVSKAENAIRQIRSTPLK